MNSHTHRPAVLLVVIMALLIYRFQGAFLKPFRPYCSVDLDWFTMSWYDTTVKKLGFPTIELFVKVSDARKPLQILIRKFTEAVFLNSYCQYL